MTVGALGSVGAVVASGGAGLLVGYAIAKTGAIDDAIDYLAGYKRPTSRMYSDAEAEKMLHPAS